MSEIEKLLSDGQRSLNLDNPKEALSFYQKVGKKTGAEN